MDNNLGSCVFNKIMPFGISVVQYVKRPDSCEATGLGLLQYHVVPLRRYAEPIMTYKKNVTIDILPWISRPCASHGPDRGTYYVS